MQDPLDSFHLLGDTIFYPTIPCRKMASQPKIRAFAVEVKIPVEKEDAWLYARMPSLVLEKTRSGKYRPSLSSLHATFVNLRFSRDGKVSHIHPRLMYFICRAFVATCNGLESTAIKLTSAAIYTGPPKKLSYPPSIPYEKIIKNSIGNTVGACQIKRCKTPTLDTHPNSKYILGVSACRACLSGIFNDDSWFSVTDINRWFAEGFLATTINHWIRKPIKHTLIGLMCSRIFQLDHTTIPEYTDLGKLASVWPVDTCIDHWDKLLVRSLKMLANMFGMLAWRQCFSMALEYRHLKQKYERVFMDVAFRYFGWMPLPCGSWHPNPAIFGTPLRSIDDPHNDDTEFPFRCFEICYKNRRRYIVMKGSTYTAWRLLLLGAEVEIHAAAVGYNPQFDFKVDASKPLPSFSRFQDTIPVFSAEHLTWGTLARLLRTKKKLVLYGSLAASLEGSTCPGVFADVLLTFLYLEPLQTHLLRYRVITHSPGFELTSLDFDDRDSEAQESALIKAKLCSPSTKLPLNPAWKRGLRIPALMVALKMPPMVGFKEMPQKLLDGIYPEVRKRKRASNDSE